jgi:hypothetical protein
MYFKSSSQEGRHVDTLMTLAGRQLQEIVLNAA